jgi:hypothetical protein
LPLSGEKKIEINSLAKLHGSIKKKRELAVIFPQKENRIIYIPNGSDLKLPSFIDN